MIGGSAGLANIATVVRLLFFVGFFAGTAVAYYYRDRFHVRQMYVVVFVVCVLAVNITSIGLPPVVDLHKFKGEGPTETTDYEIKMVDAGGEEILLDARAIEPASASRQTKLGPILLDDCTETERRFVAGYLLNEARQYRQSVESKSLLRHASVEFPRDDHGYRWTKDTLARYGKLEGVRIYSDHRTLGDDGTTIATTSATMKYEYSAPAGDAPVPDAAGRGRLCS